MPDISLPTWAGSVPQWGLLATIVLAFFKLWPVLRQQTIDVNNEQVKLYAETCTQLRVELNLLSEKLFNCEDKCDKDIRKLNDELNGMRRQHVQEQLSLINAIIASVDAPQLKVLLTSLESVQLAMQSNVLRSRSGNVIHSVGEQPEEKKDE